MFDAIIDEGFSSYLLGGSLNMTYTFDNWIDPNEGTDDTYTFESFGEGFLTYELGGDVSMTYTFDNWIDPDTGTDDTYDFESDDEGFLTYDIGGTICTIPYTFVEPMNTGDDCL